MATRPARHVARASSEETPADREDEDEEEVGMDDLVELEMGGVSVSPRGFVALLVPKGSSGSIPRAPNPVEELRDAEPAVAPGPLRVAQTLPLLISNRPEDRDGAVSEWAQAMLQLTQDPPIDMGIQLPYSALDELTGNEGSILGAVFLGEVGFAGEGDEDAASYKFESTLLAGKEFDQSTYDLRGGQEEAWRALALALRYAPYGCRIFATRKALAGVDANAFGAAGEQMVGGGEISSILRDLYLDSRASATWGISEPQRRSDVRLAFLALMCLETGMPYGGNVLVERDGEKWVIRGTADKLIIDPDIWALLATQDPKLKLKPAHV